MGIFKSNSIDEIRQREEARSLEARTLHLEKPATGEPDNEQSGMRRRDLLRRMTVVGVLLAIFGIQQWLQRKIAGIPLEKDPQPAPGAPPEETEDFFATREKVETSRESFLEALKIFKDVNDETRQLFEMARTQANFTITTEPLQTATSCADSTDDSFHVIFRKIVEEKEGHLPPVLLKYISPTDKSIIISDEITSPEWLAIFAYGALYQMKRRIELAACDGDQTCLENTMVDIGHASGELHCAILAHWQGETYQNFMAAATAENFNCKNGEDIATVKLDASAFPLPGESEAAQEQMRTTLLACLILELEIKRQALKTGESQNP